MHKRSGTEKEGDQLEYVNLGRTGLKVSRICLGCMSFGVPERGNQPWSLDEESSRPIIRAALEAGINFFDTANVYSDGTSEEILGRALKDFTRREEIVLATKVHGAMRSDPNGRGLSRKAILNEIDNSLRRLGTDYVDLYQIHRFDPDTPIEETLEALNDVVRSGKVRYIGASSMHAWRFAKALFTSDLHGWTRFVSMQNHYNLLQREEEREMLPLCMDQGVGVIPWSPLARGRLARPWGQTTRRSSNDAFGRTLYSEATLDSSRGSELEESDRKTVEVVGEIAKEHGVSMAQVALAWLLSRPGVTSPIVGVTSTEQLRDLLGALEVRLGQTELDQLGSFYTPRNNTGF
jgi:aryl-alcohol dehydrogenase-like predicted oxidoreductase